MNEAIIYYNQAIKIESEKCSEEMLSGDPFYYIASCYYHLKKYAESLKYISVAQTQFQKINEKKFLQKAKDMYSKCKKEYIKSIKENIEKANNSDDLNIFANKNMKDVVSNKDIFDCILSREKKMMLLAERHDVMCQLNNRYLNNIL